MEQTKCRIVKIELIVIYIDTFNSCSLVASSAVAATAKMLCRLLSRHCSMRRARKICSYSFFSSTSRHGLTLK